MTTLLYVVVMRVAEQYQLCGAYRNEAQAGIHLAHVRTIMPGRTFEVWVCPFWESETAHRLEQPQEDTP